MPTNKIPGLEDIQSLIDKLDEANTAYYLEDSPVMSDHEYDLSLRKLENLEKETGIVNPNSPTQRPGTSVKNSQFRKIPHENPMLSLENAMNQEEVEEFISKVNESLGRQVTFCIEPKYDGSAVSLIYLNGLLTRAATRGDGVIGEDITENIRTIKNIPQQLPQPISLEIRGEVVIQKNDFRKLNQQRMAAGQEQFVNPRNAAAGSLRQLDSSITASRPLSFIAYSILPIEETLNRTLSEHQSSTLILLSSWGFQVGEFTLLHSRDEILQFIHQQEEKRQEFNYEIDGLVLKVDDFDLQERLGARSRTPRWAVAAKFKPEEAEAILRDITVQVGRTGALTPVAELEPTYVGGVTISRATLHNQDEIDRKDIRIGDTVIIRRQGDVIPAVVKVLSNRRTGGEIPYRLPDSCPVCKGKVGKINSSDVVIRCLSYHCPAQRLGKFVQFVSRGGLDIQGLSEKRLELLLENGLVKDRADLFRLNPWDISDLDRMGKKSTENLIREIKRAMNRVPLHKFLYSLGIRHIGQNTSKTISSYFLEKVDGSKKESLIDSLRLQNLTATKNELLDLEDIGDSTATAFAEYFQDEENFSEFEKLVSVLDLSLTAEEKIQSAITGKTLVITGDLDAYSRDEAKSIVERLGGKVTGSVSKKTDYLVVGHNPGKTKTNKAKELGTPILSEVEFINLIQK